MRPVLLFTTLVLLCCAVTERQYTAIYDEAAHLPPGGALIAEGAGVLPPDLINEPAVLTVPSNSLIIVRLPIQRTPFIHRSDFWGKSFASLPASQVKKTYDIKSVDLIPFKLRI